MVAGQSFSDITATPETNLLLIFENKEMCLCRSYIKICEEYRLTL
jgi:hypothetical protein